MLINRIEAAGAEEQRALMEEAWNCPRCSDDCGSANPPVIFCPTERYFALLDAEAYVDAALMLVPEGFRVRDISQHVEMVRWWSRLESPACISYDGTAATPALAIAAASLRAGGIGD